ncbi:DUF6538 domain-containing protein [Komagataeibacter saccharivorans]|uniref:DUF6538 domain-containing protein n=1 Tax=Komagataeibacter saccharivorans TaxID=265959 RepID=UPI0027E42C69|nr:DUF6538 domain-containing protein [Komagataeibacter saccharivorans]
MLIRLQSGYHFCRAVPSHTRDIVGKKELWLSLDTNKREVAKPYACAVFAETERLFRSVMHVWTALTMQVESMTLMVGCSHVSGLFAQPGGCWP